MATIVSPGSRRELANATATVAGLLTAAFVLGSLLGVACIAIGLVTLHSSVGLSLLIFGAGLPMLLVQDVCRFLCIMAGLPKRAVVIDGIWAALELLGLTLLALAGVTTIEPLILAWALGGVISALIGVRYVRGHLLNWPAAVAWLKSTRGLGPSYAVDFLAGQGSAQVLTFALAAILGLSAAGDYRACLTVFALTGVLDNGLRLTLIRLR